MYIYIYTYIVLYPLYHLGLTKSQVRSMDFVAASQCALGDHIWLSTKAAGLSSFKGHQNLGRKGATNHVYQ
jgi:hypothetical protein